MKVNRQTFLGATGAAVLAASAANAAEAPYRVLAPSEGAALGALGETLVPGARDAGIARYIDDQLAVPTSQSLLLLQYFDLTPPFLPFYRGGLAALDGACRRLHGAAFADADEAARTDVVRRLSSGAIANWSGPPAPLFYLALRGDAMDVVYGTVAGFRKLGIPYMPHVPPSRTW